MNDIRPNPQQKRPTTPTPFTEQSTSLEPINDVPTVDIASDTPSVIPPKKRKSSIMKWILLSIVALTIIIGGMLVWWYQDALQPKSSQKNAQQKNFVIAEGQTPDVIAANLEKEGYIKSASAFSLYVRLSGKSATLKAGPHAISPAMTSQQISDALSKNIAVRKTIMFYPGATLFDPLAKDDAKRMDAYTVLVRAGYSPEEVKKALTKQYTHPLFADKPAGVSNEGYIYGETYYFDQDASLDTVMNHVFNEQYAAIKKYKIVEEGKKRNLNLHQMITLASIVQKEVHKTEDMGNVAQVFYNRLKTGMMLGSDVTYQYISRQEGKQNQLAIDSPYNTRKYAGLPPGPIASVGEKALMAVANPTPGDYLFFVAGDDGVTYFSKTVAEHEANAKKHCIKLCAVE